MEALNDTTVYDYYDYNYEYLLAGRITTWTVISIGLPLTLLAFWALYSLMRQGQVAPIYVINLLISDLIQMCSMAVIEATWGDAGVSENIYFTGLMASAGFMVCLALERYLVIACPLWYRFRRNNKISLFVCFMVWASSITLFIVIDFIPHLFILFLIALLLPFPVLIFCLVGTLKALSASCVPPEEKRRIVGVLVVVLLNHTLLFLPLILSLLQYYATIHPRLSLIFIQFSPLGDLVLYIFMRKGTIDKLLARLCLCTREQEQGQINPDITCSDTISSV